MSQENQKNDLFKNLHDLQYDRIGKLETQKNYITSFVTGLSTITIAYSFLGDKALNIFSGVVLPLIFILANIVAANFLIKTRAFIKMHHIRAEEMRKLFAPEFQEIYSRVKKPNSDKDKFNRTNYMVALHYLISLIGLGIIMKFVLAS